MTERTIKFPLTKDELWSLWQQYQASFTDIDGMSEMERNLEQRLGSAYYKVQKASRR